MQLDSHLRDQLIGLLDDGWAYDGPRAVLADVPLAFLNARPPHTPYTAWHVIEHVRIEQQSILEQIGTHPLPHHRPHDASWPDPSATVDAAGWQETYDAVFADMQALKDVARRADLSAPCANRPEVSILHALFNIAAHNHYHFGEIAILRQVMQAWSADHEV